MPRRDASPAEDDVLIVVSTAPPGLAHDIARTLVEEHLAACVNVVPGLRSVYRWEGTVRDDPESLLWAKTTRARVAALRARLRALHPYSVPEEVHLAPAGGSEDYFSWVRGAVSPEGTASPPPPARGPTKA